VKNGYGLDRNIKKPLYY